MINRIFLITCLAVALGLSALILLLPTETGEPATQSLQLEQTNNEQNNSFVITDARVFDGQRVLDNHNIRVKDGIIVDISRSPIDAENGTVIDAKGMTVLPGLIDAHTHTYGNGLTDALRFGVSVHLDMFTTEEALKSNRAIRQSMDNTAKTDLFSSGTMATVAGGHGTQYGFAIDTIDGIDEIAQWIGLRKQAGVDYIKLVYMPYQNYMPSLDRETAKAIIDEAHQQGLKVFAHISEQAAAKDMIEDGIDGLVHIFADSIVSDELLTLAKKSGVFIIPTLAVIASVDQSDLAKALSDNPLLEGRLSNAQLSTLNTNFGAKIPGFDYATAKINVKRFFDSGVPILAGSDAPNPGTAYGVSALHEVILLVDAGLSEIQAIRAASSLPAKIFNIERGALSIGSRADLLLVEGNPFSDIHALLRTKAVFKNGYSVNTGIASNTAKMAEDTRLGDFENTGLSSINDFVWTASDDGMANGQSKANIQVLKESNAENTVLKVSASVNGGFPYPWAGAAVGDFSLPIEGIDLSKLSYLRFKVKGSPGTYRVMAFDATAAGIPPTQNFDIGEQWQDIRISLDKFKNFDKAQFSGFAFVAGPELGKFEFLLDDVHLE